MLLLLFCMWTSATATLYQLPTFVPNEYLYQTHADKGKEKWEIYAWAIRDVMSKASKIPTLDVQCRENW
jgi:hypothetical protein